MADDTEDTPPLVEFFEAGDRTIRIGDLIVITPGARHAYFVRDYALAAIPRGMRNGARRLALDEHVRQAMHRHPDYVEITVVLRGGA